MSDEQAKPALPFSDFVEGGKVTRAFDTAFKKPFPDETVAGSSDANDCYWGGLRFSEGAQVTQGSRTFICSGGRWTVS